MLAHQAAVRTTPRLARRRASRPCRPPCRPRGPAGRLLGAGRQRPCQRERPRDSEVHLPVAGRGPHLRRPQAAGPHLRGRPQAAGPSRRPHPAPGLRAAARGPPPRSRRRAPRRRLEARRARGPRGRRPRGQLAPPSPLAPGWGEPPTPRTGVRPEAGLPMTGVAGRAEAALGRAILPGPIHKDPKRSPSQRGHGPKVHKLPVRRAILRAQASLPLPLPPRSCARAARREARGRARAAAALPHRRDRHLDQQSSRARRRRRAAASPPRSPRGPCAEAQGAREELQVQPSLR